MTSSLQDMAKEQLLKLEAQWTRDFSVLLGQNLKLDLSRGKPSDRQLELSHKISNGVVEDYFSTDGTDSRNYGNLKGIIEARELGSKILGTTVEETFAVGNSSLSLMHLASSTALNQGLWQDDRRWKNANRAKMITQVPGYDRHFTICDSLGIDMVNIKMTSDGPDMNAIEQRITKDPEIKGLWCVPKYSNPTGCTYSPETVQAIAELPKKSAAEDFVIFWDNAYAVHEIKYPGDKLASVANACKSVGTLDHLVQFGSTSKITFASGGIAFVSSSPLVLDTLEKQMSTFSIGSDKVNQLKHARYLNKHLEEHMQDHAKLLSPKFALVLQYLENDLGSLDIAKWTDPNGGYFISLDMNDPLADQVIDLAKTTGLILTPAGATYPAGTDDENRNIRIAPSFAEQDELKTAMEVLTLCARLVTVRDLIKNR